MPLTHLTYFVSFEALYLLNSYHHHFVLKIKRGLYSGKGGFEMEAKINFVDLRYSFAGINALVDFHQGMIV
jgi:hypothetical protein